MSKYVIETKNLTKQYGTQKSVADLNIHVQQGRIYGLLGRYPAAIPPSETTCTTGSRK